MPSYISTQGISGNVFALMSAGAWALSAILFQRLGEKIPPVGLNFVKCIIGVFYLGILLIFIKKEAIVFRDSFFLGVSGLLGIACGDTFFFKALMHLGPRRILLLETLGPVATAVLAVIFLSEKLSFFLCVGMLVTIAGIALALGGNPDNKAEKRRVSVGIKYAILFVLCNSIGIILAKIGMTASVSALEATFIRLFWGIIGLTLWGGLTRQLGGWLIIFRNFNFLKSAFFAVFIAVFGGFWCSLLAIKYTYVSIAVILGSTTPIFILPMSVVILKEKMSMRKIAGAFVVVLGVILVFLR